MDVLVYSEQCCSFYVNVNNMHFICMYMLGFINFDRGMNDSECPLTFQLETLRSSHIITC